MSELAAALLEKIQSRRARTGVVGLGYVGLPLAVEFARAGFHTTGIDLDQRKVDAINGGRSYIPDVSTADVAALQPGRPARRHDRLRRRQGARHHQHLRADAAAQDQGPGHVVHRLGGRGDREASAPGHARSSSSRRPIRARPTRWCSRILEATGPQGRRRLLPRVLARARRSGQPDVPHPQRAEGGRRADARLHRARGARSTRTAIETIVPVSSTRVAEMVKLLENTFRAVNIGLVNELALMCDKMGIDVWEVVDAAKTKPFGFMPFYPGPGLGGHCIPIDPFYLSWKAKQTGFDPRFIELAGHINGGDAALRRREGRRRAEHQAQVDQRLEDPHRRGRLQARHRRHARVAGARRHGTAAREGARRCRTRTRTCRRCTPATGRGTTTSRRRRSTRGTIAQYDCVVIVTDHKAFDYDAIVAEADVIVDTRNAIKKRCPNVFRIGAPHPETADQKIEV